MRLALGTDWSFRLRAASVQFSRSVMSDSLLSHGLQHIRLPCPAPTPRTCSNSWLHSQSFLHNLCKQGDIFSLPSSCLSPFFPSSFLLFFISFLPLSITFIYMYLFSAQGAWVGLWFVYEVLSPYLLFGGGHFIQGRLNL